LTVSYKPEAAKLCNYAMCGDRGIGESFGAALELPQAISRGDETYQIRFVRHGRSMEK
jgi:hypothetical protein